MINIDEYISKFHLAADRDHGELIRHLWDSLLAEHHDLDPDLIIRSGLLISRLSAVQADQDILTWIHSKKSWQLALLFLQGYWSQKFNLNALRVNAFLELSEDYLDNADESQYFFGLSLCVLNKALLKENLLSEAANVHNVYYRLKLEGALGHLLQTAWNASLS
jgi:hypothetical protein